MLIFAVKGSLGIGSIITLASFIALLVMTAKAQDTATTPQQDGTGGV